MNKTGTYFLIFILSIVIFLLGFNYNTNKQPYTSYKVYLESEYIGMISSKEDLEFYINSQADDIRENLKKYSLRLDAIEKVEELISKNNIDKYTKYEKAKYILINHNIYNLNELDLEKVSLYVNDKLYNVTEAEKQEMKDYYDQNSIYLYAEDIYTPNGIDIRKVYTYDTNIISIEEAYKKIIEKQSCSVAGYKFTIKSKNEEIDDIVLYTLDSEIFSKAIENVINIFLDPNIYKAYKNDLQNKIETTGSIIENVYVEEDITYKAVNISIGEKIYTSANDLAAYLLYGDNFEQKTVEVAVGDSIESISFNNEISEQEFLIFNPQYTSRDNLLVPGSEAIISTIDPKIQIVVEYYEVVDKEVEFSVQEQYDENLTQGSVLVTQEGKNGLERVSQNVKSINGEIKYVDPAGKEVIQSSIPKIISIGTKYIPNVGSTASWEWPTDSGYTFSSYYGYRLSVFGEGNFHSGLDIAGTGYGSNVYAANNGTIEILTDLGNYSYGKYIMVNHNNGYYTIYAHMSAFEPGLSVGSTVSRGQIIGKIGSSGWATGPHLHYEVRTCAQYSCITNPLNYYR